MLALRRSVTLGLFAVWLTACQRAPMSEFATVASPSAEPVAGPTVLGCVAGLRGVSTIAGGETPGTDDGPGSEARFRLPYYLAYDRHANRLVVADRAGSRLCVLGPDGQVHTIAGPKPFASLAGVAVNAAGDVLAADPLGNRIWKVSPTGHVEAFAGDGTPGSVDGAAMAARFDLPEGLATGPDDALYVTDLGSSRIRKVAPDGTTSTLAVGHPEQGRESFMQPFGITVDEAGTVYFTSAMSVVLKLTPQGVLSALTGWGLAFEDGPASRAKFSTPTGIAYDGGHLYVADLANHRIRDVDLAARLVTTLAGDGQPGYLDAPALKAQFRDPTGVAVGACGEIYVADQANYRIRRIGR
ncbi:MAG: hypothetical protein JWM80_5365 [Cyanobacteria bacterium RYN_339]|nr:hypothetical protein [Cyanobacteria bacterium RYN_339]